MSEIIYKPLKGNKNFELVYSSGKKFYSPSINCVLQFNDTNNVFPNNIKDKCIIHIGLIVTKKISKKAVVRNRVKRLLRESIRTYLKKFCDNENLIKINTIIFYWREPFKVHPMLIRFDKVYQSLEDIFSKIDKYQVNNKNIK